MFHDTTPAQLDHDGTIDPWAPFRLVNTGEINTLLRQVRDGAVPVVLCGPSGQSVSCALWALDSTARRLSFTVDETHPNLQALIHGDEAVAVTYLDAVKLQFDLMDLVLVRGKSGVALQAAWPGAVLRFQRRDSFRVRPSERIAPKLVMRHPSIPDMQLELRILDLSVGGCAVLLPQDVPELRPGVLLHGVQVLLDADTGFVASLVMRHMASLEGGNPGLRVGCEWSRLDAEAERALQRWVNQTQKRQRLLTLS